MDEEEDMEEDSVMYSIRKKASLSTKDSSDVKRRADELSWLHDTLANIPSSDIPSLVAHRGEPYLQKITDNIQQLLMYTSTAYS